ncbi:MAG: hypothetical protein FJY85_13530, partial [Deltaproteobacteria bacterium]|nr:hypothetical protein [Deltaproteobacteria bacterium]
MESTLRAVGVLCFGEVNRVLNAKESFPMDKLLEKPVILELDALTNSDKTFFIEALLLWIHHHRLAQEARETFKHAILIEEAHHILLRKKQEATGEETVTDVILREIRELGEAIILIDQHPSLISKPGLGNTYCTIAMNLKHRSDIAMIADCLLLDAESARYLGKLEVGWGVVRLQGRWFEPFLVKFPLIRLEKGKVTDKAISERMPPYGRASPAGGRPYRARSELVSPKAGCSIPGEAQEQAAAAARISGKEDEFAVRRTRTTSGAISLTTEERTFLDDVLTHKASTIRERYSRLSLNAYRGNLLQHSLLSKGLIFSQDISTGKSRVKVLCLTNE